MSLFRKKTSASQVEISVPAHIGIIMDGNGRWAKKRGLPRTAGHAAGINRVRTIVKHCEKRGVGYVTFYIFSTENWKRPKEEVDGLMNLLRNYLVDSMDDFDKENIRLSFIGDRTRLSQEIQDLMAKAEAITANKTGMVFNLAINYGGRAELAYAMRQIAEKVKAGEIAPEEITEDTITEHLYTVGQPDVDLMLRPSGEYRLSNFLIWQCAYAEYVFENVLWPDFTTDDLDRAIEEYSSRNRRFGGLSKS